jgi:hypothetical protein
MKADPSAQEQKKLRIHFKIKAETAQRSRGIERKASSHRCIKDCVGIEKSERKHFHVCAEIRKKLKSIFAYAYKGLRRKGKAWIYLSEIL